MHAEDKRGALRWRAAALFGQTGRVALLPGILACGLFTFWMGSMVPQGYQQRANLAQIEARLKTPLPLDNQQPALQSRVSQSEYQLVGLVFDRLQQSGLRIEASRYQLEKDGEKPVLRLDIPLQGEYLPLVDALEALSRTLPLRIDQISLRRSGPTKSLLNVTLQLRLLKESP
uniref:hypothetical protein n=1 Tax=Scandinavium goeteborgense TaxID=1851514 RepID=UPI001358B5B9|nr:hypothetical protein [Scandinavium goeteborgense]